MEENAQNKENEKNWEEIEKYLKKERQDHQSNIHSANKFEDRVFSTLYEDTKVDPELRELFHKLNYQRVVDELNQSIRRWKIWLGIISGSIIILVYVWSMLGDSLIPLDQHGSVLEDYEQMMSAVDFELNWQKYGKSIYPDPQDHTFVELSIDSIAPRQNTERSNEAMVYTSKAFWNVYFTRYLLLRIFISVVIIMFIGAGIRIYKRLRRDKMAMVYKEEATTTMIYFIQKYMVSEVNGKKVMKPRDKDRIVHLFPLFAKELYYNPQNKIIQDNNDSITHRMMEMMENIVGNAFSSGSNGKNGTRTTG